MMDDKRMSEKLEINSFANCMFVLSLIVTLLCFALVYLNLEYILRTVFGLSVTP